LLPRVGCSLWNHLLRVVVRADKRNRCLHLAGVLVRGHLLEAVNHTLHLLGALLQLVQRLLDVQATLVVLLARIVEEHRLVGTLLPFILI